MIIKSNIVDAEAAGVGALYNGDNPKGIQHLKRALELNRSSNILDDKWESTCYFNIAEAYKALLQNHEAIEHFKKSIQKNKYNEDAYTSLAECYFALGTSEALQDVVRVLTSCTSLFPENETAHYNLGIAYFQLREHRKAYYSFKKYQDLGGEDADNYVQVLAKFA